MNGEDVLILVQVFSGIGILLTGVFAFFTYRKNTKLKAAELLIELEKEFRENILPIYVEIETASMYENKYIPAIKNALRKLPIGTAKDSKEKRSVVPSVSNAPSQEEQPKPDLSAITDLDKLLRFFVLCKQLSKLKVDNSSIIDTYWFYLGILIDRNTEITIPRNKVISLLYQKKIPLSEKWPSLHESKKDVNRSDLADYVQKEYGTLHRWIIQKSNLKRIEKEYSLNIENKTALKALSEESE